MTDPKETAVPDRFPWESAKPTIARRVADDVARRIIRGEIVAGELLTEVQVAAEAGASRTPVREAMLQLQRWGLVQLMPKKGAIVKPLSGKEVRDLLGFRELLEVSAIGAALANGGDTELADALAANLSAQEVALDAGDVAEFSARDVEFHLRIMQAGENAVVDDVMLTLAPRFARVIHEVARHDGSDARRLLDDHRAIHACIEAGDVEGARRAIAAHIAEGIRRLAR